MDLIGNLFGVDLCGVNLEGVMILLVLLLYDENWIDLDGYMDGFMFGEQFVLFFSFCDDMIIMICDYVGDIGIMIQ